MRFAVLVLVLASTAAPRVAAQPRAGGAVTWPVVSSGAKVAGGVIFSLDGDLRGARAIDVVSERLLWQAHLQDQPRGGHDLQVLPNGRVLIVAGHHLFVLDPATGAQLAHHQLDEGSFGARSFLWAENGVCGMNTECAFQPIDCTDARPLGDPIRGVMQHRTRYDRSGVDSGCWSFHVDLVGVRRDRILLDVRNWSRSNADRESHPRANRPLTRLYLDTRTGALRSNRVVAERTRRAAPSPTDPPTALDVLRHYDGGARRAEIRRRSTGEVLDRLPHDAWLLGEHQGRSIIFVHHGDTTPGELRLYH